MEARDEAEDENEGEKQRANANPKTNPKTNSRKHKHTHTHTNKEQAAKNNRLHWSRECGIGNRQYAHNAIDARGLFTLNYARELGQLARPLSRH